MTLITGFPANIFIEKFGSRKSILIANILFVIGSIIKCFVNVNIWSVHLGQIIAGLGSPFVLNGIAEFSDSWYTGESVSKWGINYHRFLIILILERNFHISFEFDEPNWNYRIICVSFYFCRS